MIFLSIITVSYNALSLLKETSASLPIADSRIETIIIDGDSTDGTKDFMQGSDCRYQIKVSEPDSGIYDAMNKGIKIARGKYLIFMNCGDTFLPEFSLDAILGYLVKPRVSFLVGDLLLSNGVLIKYRSIVFDKVFFVQGGAVPHQSTFIPRDAFHKFGLYDTRYAVSADQEFFLRCCVGGMRFVSIGLTVSRYDMGGVSSQEHSKDTIKQERNLFLSIHVPFTTPYMKWISFQRSARKELRRKFARLLELLDIRGRIK